MKSKILLIYLVLQTCICSKISAQSTFGLNGNIKSFEEKYITFTLYKNWVEDPIDYTLPVDENGNFVLEFPLDEISYCDINFGSKGLYTWIIEPNDKIEINIDYENFENSFQILGPGSAKWVYLKEHKKKYEDDQDWDYEYKKYKKVGRNGFFEVTQFMYNEQLGLLNKHKDLISDDFYTLQRADLYGKVSNVELDFLLANKLFNQKEFERFQLKAFNAKNQNKSFYLGIFVENIISNHNQIASKFQKSSLLEYETIQSYFSKYDYVSKAMIDRILANKVIDFINLDGYTEEIKILVANYKESSKNKIYVNAVLAKLNSLQSIQPGNVAKNFILPNEKNNLVALKDFRGKNVFLSFYASWCGPCLNDLQYLSIVNNYFKGKADIAFVSISTDDAADFKEYIKTSKTFGVNLNAAGNNKLKVDYDLEFVPKYLLLDKNGMIISEKLIEPANDEGRGLILQIERLINQK